MAVFSAQPPLQRGVGRHHVVDAQRFFLDRQTYRNPYTEGVAASLHVRRDPCNTVSRITQHVCLCRAKTETVSRCILAIGGSNDKNRSSPDFAPQTVVHTIGNERETRGSKYEYFRLPQSLTFRFGIELLSKSFKRHFLFPSKANLYRISSQTTGQHIG